MPYTPPAVQSPARSASSSSLSSRPSADHHTITSPRSPAPQKPSLPRSTSSTQYLSRARRSPSCQLDTPPTSSDAKQSPETAQVYASSLAATRQKSPEARSHDSALPIGAVLSPPDSTANSSDDEDRRDVRSPDVESEPRGRQRVQLEDMQEFEESYRRNKQHKPRGASPSTGEPFPHVGSTVNGDASADASGAQRPHLSHDARKLTHSRSSTTSSIFLNRPQRPQSTSDGSEEDDDDDNNELSAPKKPMLLRKKSGELVKPAIRPQSRRKHSSMPGTPTFSKAVHFNEDIAQVRHFLQVDKPIAVSASASPVATFEEEHEFPFYAKPSAATDLEIHIRNFPRDDYARMTNPVRVQKLAMLPDQSTLMGVVACANLAFNKFVVARFTFDHWKTTSEVVAEFSNDPAHRTSDGEDYFVFNIKLGDQAYLESKTLLICVKYNVNGQDHWDNNKDMNYQVDFTKKPKPALAKPATQASSARTIPRSKHNSPGAVSTPTRPATSADEDFDAEFDGGSSIRFKNAPPGKHILADTPMPRKTSASSQAFGSRYDFGASLTAALTKAQTTLGERSGIKGSNQQQGKSTSLLREQPASSALHTNTLAPSLRSTLPIPRGHQSGGDSPRADALLASKQSLDSRAYQEFVSKFCFVSVTNSISGSAHGR